MEQDILTKVRMIEEGIVPFDWPDCHVNDGLHSMPEGLRRKARRKFRKLWRKALKKKSSNAVLFRNLVNSCGVGLDESKLRPHHRRARAKLVIEYLYP